MTNNPKSLAVTLALLRVAIQGEEERLQIDEDTWKEAMNAGFLIVIRSYEQVNKTIYGKNFNYHCYF